VNYSSVDASQSLNQVQTIPGASEGRFQKLDEVHLREDQGEGLWVLKLPFIF